MAEGNFGDWKNRKFIIKFDADAIFPFSKPTHKKDNLYLTL